MKNLNNRVPPPPVAGRNDNAVSWQGLASLVGPSSVKLCGTSVALCVAKKYSYTEFHRETQRATEKHLNHTLSKFFAAPQKFLNCIPLCAPVSSVPPWEPKNTHIFRYYLLNFIFTQIINHPPLPKFFLPQHIGNITGF